MINVSNTVTQQFNNRISSSVFASSVHNIVVLLQTLQRWPISYFRYCFRYLWSMQLIVSTSKRQFFGWF